MADKNFSEAYIDNPVTSESADGTEVIPLVDSGLGDGAVLLSELAKYLHDTYEITP